MNLNEDKLCVIGNEFLDIIDIINYDGKYKRIIQDGGIHNIKQGTKIALKKNTANILITHHGTESTIDKGYQCPVEGPYSKAGYGWVHLAYANLINIDFTKVEAKIKSCDLTKHYFTFDLSKAYNNIACCDYVFLSNEDNQNLLKHFLFEPSSNFSGWLVEHSSQGSVACQPKKIKDVSHLFGDTCGSDGINVSHYWHQKENFLFTVGAGDRFAGYFIEHRMNNPESYIKNSQEYAHTKVLQWLKEVNENI